MNESLDCFLILKSPRIIFIIKIKSTWSLVIGFKDVECSDLGQ